MRCRKDAAWGKKVQENQDVSTSSLPGLSRPSTSLSHGIKVVDARDKPGHDVGEAGQAARIRNAFILGMVATDRSLTRGHLRN